MWIWIWWIYPYYILIWWMLIYVDIYIDDECDLFHQCQDEPNRMPEFGRWLVFIFSAISKTWFALKTNWFDSYITAIAPLMLTMIFFYKPAVDNHGTNCKQRLRRIHICK